MQTRILAAAAATVMLAACGGGGGSGEAPPVTNVAPIVAASGGQPLTLSSSQVKAALQTRLDAADSLLSTDIAGFGTVPDIAVSCSGAVCSAAGSNFYLSDFDLSGSYEGIMTRNGISVGQGRSTETEQGIKSDTQIYGGWADHNFFWIDLTTFEERGEVYGGAAMGGSIGNATGSTPVSGSAVWRGVMVGLELLRGEGVQGDTTITADFAASNVDVAFTNIHDIETGADRASIAFSDIPFTADGFASSSNGRIEGKFYGTGHAEAGGIFERGNTIGSFGARRQ